MSASEEIKLDVSFGIPNISCVIPIKNFDFSSSERQKLYGIVVAILKSKSEEELLEFFKEKKSIESFDLPDSAALNKYKNFIDEYIIFKIRFENKQSYVKDFKFDSNAIEKTMKDISPLKIVSAELSTLLCRTDFCVSEEKAIGPNPNYSWASSLPGKFLCIANFVDGCFMPPSGKFPPKVGVQTFKCKPVFQSQYAEDVKRNFMLNDKKNECLNFKFTPNKTTLDPSEKRSEIYIENKKPSKSTTPPPPPTFLPGLCQQDLIECDLNAVEQELKNGLKDPRVVFKYVCPEGTAKLSAPVHTAKTEVAKFVVKRNDTPPPPEKDTTAPVFEEEKSVAKGSKRPNESDGGEELSRKKKSQKEEKAETKEPEKASEKTSEKSVTDEQGDQSDSFEITSLGKLTFVKPCIVYELMEELHPEKKFELFKYKAINNKMFLCLVSFTADNLSKANSSVKFIYTDIQLTCYCESEMSSDDFANCVKTEDFEKHQDIVKNY